nr:ABC transporter ATP-binding protein [uncultured Lachnoclostridium sp.]
MIKVDSLCVKYKDFCAVDGISLHIRKNEIYGIIGMNGAGKTSTVECIEGLRKYESGEIRICGLDPNKDRKRVHEIIGIQLQDTNYQNNAKVYELCELFSSFYSEPVPYKQLLEKMGLWEKRRNTVSKLSGGQRQKLSIVLALIGKPKVLFLDELTTGLDPNSRHQMWDLLKELKNQGITIVLISHFMDEVQAVCDRIAIMDKGKILIVGTIEEILKKYNLTQRMIFQCKDTRISEIENLELVDKVERVDREITVFGKGDNFVASVVSWLETQEIEYSSLDIQKPNLEDVFLYLSGRTFENGEME